MSRHRSHSDPASPLPSPPLSSSSRLPGQYASLIQQTQRLALDDNDDQSWSDPRTSRRDEYADCEHMLREDYNFVPFARTLPTPTPPSPLAETAALTEASLASHTHSRPLPSPRPDRPKYPSFSYVDNPYPAIGGYGYPRKSATPSTTSVSDGEEDEEEGYELRKEDKAVAVGWVDRKGKGKATDLGRGQRRKASVGRRVVEEGKGVAGTLPEEVLMHIFRLVPTRHLLSAMLVSRTWCLSAFPLLYARPSITSVAQLVSLCRLLTAPLSTLSLPYHTQIRRMNFNLIASELPSELFVPLRVCIRMERITMVGCSKVSASALRAVIDEMPDLVAIDMASSDAVDDSVLKVLGRRCPRLQGLNLSGCKSVGDEGVKAIAKGCRMLRRMKVADCHRITDDSIIHLARLCPFILELDIASLPQLRDTSLYAIWLNCIHLRELKLGKNANFTGGGGIPDLPGLYYEPNDSILRRSYAGWVGYLEKHPDLSLSQGAEPASTGDGLGGDTFDAPSTLSPPLLSPSLSIGRYNYRNRASTVDSYIDRDRRKIDLTLLRPLAPTFDVLRTVDFTSCSELDDLALINLVRCAPKIRKLTLAKCVKVGDRGLEAVARLGKGLLHLHLGHLVQITDVAITKIARSCTRLRYLDVACCPLLTDLSVHELSSNVPKLRRIGLVKVVNLTDEAIYALAERHTSLEKLHLSYCDNISVRAITFLLNRLLSLVHLSLTGVKAFRNEDLQRFRKDVPADFSDHQAASFCVYSYHGINSLRLYLNTLQQANTAGGGGGGGDGSDTSTRRGSGDSDSSLPLPGYSPGHGEGGVYVGPAYARDYRRGGSGLGNTPVNRRDGEESRLSAHIASTWGLAPALDTARFEREPTATAGSGSGSGRLGRIGGQGGGFSRALYSFDMEEERSVSPEEIQPGHYPRYWQSRSPQPTNQPQPQSYPYPQPQPQHQLGDQVYRRVSTPTLPIPPSARVASGSTSGPILGIGRVPATRSHPRGPRESGVGTTGVYSTRSGLGGEDVMVPIENVGGEVYGRGEEERLRIPGGYPSERLGVRGGGGPVWGPEPGSGMVWSYGHTDVGPGPSGSVARSGTMSRESSGEFRSAGPNLSLRPDSTSPSPIPPISTPSPPPPLGRYRASTISPRRSPPPSSLSRSSSPHLPPSAYPTASSSSGYTHIPGGYNRASTGSIYDTSYTNIQPERSSTSLQTQTQPQTDSFSSYLAQGRERGGSVSSALTGLATRLRRPSLSIPGVVGEGSPLRWVAEMVGWADEGSGSGSASGGGGEGGRQRVGVEESGREQRGRYDIDEGPRGEMRSSEPYDPYIPSGSKGSGVGQQAPGGNKKMQDIQAQIDDTVGIMHENITKVAERGERLDALQDKTDTLAASAQGFRRGANKMRKQMWLKDMKWRVAIGVGIAILLVVIIVPIVQHFTKKE